MDTRDTYTQNMIFEILKTHNEQCLENQGILYAREVPGNITKLSLQNWMSKERE